MITRYTLFLSIIMGVGILMSCKTVQKTHSDVPSLEFREIFADNLGNMYVVTDKSLLIKYNNEEKILFEFSHPEWLELSSVDVKDPYKIALFYLDQQKIVLLDNTLNPLSSIDLDEIGNMFFTAMCRSKEGSFWLYDSNEQQLVLIDLELNILRQSFPLYQEGLDGFSPSSIRIDHNIIIAGDTSGRIIIFDHLGNFKKKILLEPFKQFDLVGNKLLLLREEGFYLFDLFSFETTVIPDSNFETEFSYRIDRQNMEIILFENEGPFIELKRIEIP